MATFTSLREKIEKLESEKADLLAEIKKLKKAGDEEANALEEEVTTLGEDVESLKELLGSFK